MNYDYEPVNFSHATKDYVRINFIRKVYLIVATQLLLTAALTIWVYNDLSM